MNRNSFYDLISNPVGFDDIQVKRLEEVVTEFQYFNSARILLLKAYQERDHFNFSSLLSQASLHAQNRKQLFTLIQNEIETDEAFPVLNEMYSNVLSKETENEIPEPEAEISEDMNAAAPIEISETAFENEIQNELESISDTESNFDSIIEEHSLPIIETETDIEVEKAEPEPQPVIQKSLEEIIAQRLAEIKGMPATENIELVEETLFEESIVEVAIELEEREIALDVTNEMFIADEPTVVFAEQPIIEVSEFEVSEVVIPVDERKNGVETELEILSEQTEKPALFVVNEEVAEVEVADEPVPHSFSEWLRLKALQSKSEVKVHDHVDAPAIENNFESKPTESVSVSVEMPELQKSAVIEQQKERIDTFIKNDPRIEIKKHEFYSPSNMARKSVSFDSEVVSETLAEIFVSQGLHEKAIFAYQKLSLKYPDKNTFFAARIKKIKSLIQSNKK